MKENVIYQFLLSTDAFTEEQLAQGVNCRNGVGDSALHVACLFQDREIAEYLIEQGAVLDWQGEFGFTPLHCAAFRDNASLVRLLLASGADASVTDDGGETPWELARSSGYVHTANLLAALGPGAA